MLATVAGSGPEIAQFDDIVDIAASATGMLAVVESANSRVQILQPSAAG